MSAPVAVISGGNGGLGRALGAALRAQGWRLHLIDRNFAPEAAPAGVVRHLCDLSDPTAREAVFAVIRSAEPQLDLVIYNAGVTWIGPVEALSEAAHRQLFEVNYFAACAMARAFSPALRAGRGTHLAISSVAGFAPLHHRTAYAGSKHALEGFFKSLRAEEEAHGVRVQIAAPAFIATNPGRPETTAEGLARPGSAADSLDCLSPEAAVAQILRGLRRGRAMIPVGRVAHLSWWLVRLTPGLMHHAMMRGVAKNAAQ